MGYSSCNTRNRKSLWRQLRTGRCRAPENLDLEVTVMIRQNIIIHSTPIGEGSDAKVREATLLGEDGSRKHVAVKISGDSRSAIPRLQSEKENYLSLLPHKNILEFYGSGTLRQPGSEEKCFIIVKRMKTSLNKLVRDDDFRASCTFGDCVELFLDIACGLQHIHGHGMVHSDIKPDNVLIGADNKAVVADLSRSMWLLGPKSTISHIEYGTMRYMAPEVKEKLTRPDDIEISGSQSHISISEYSDIYSFGISMLECLELLRELPINEQLRDSYISLEGSVSNPDYWIPRNLRELIKKCTNYCPEKNYSKGSHYGRPSCTEIIRKLNGMKSASWYNERVQGYVQPTGDQGLREAINQAIERCHHLLTRPLYTAAQNFMARTASFIKTRLRRQAQNTAVQHIDGLLNERVASLCLVRNP